MIIIQTQNSCNINVYLKYDLFFKTGIARVLGIGRIKPPPPATFKADHPFVFLLMIGDFVLFIGRMSIPN